MDILLNSLLNGNLANANNGDVCPGCDDCIVNNKFEPKCPYMQQATANATKQQQQPKQQSKHQQQPAYMSSAQVDPQNLLKILTALTGTASVESAPEPQKNSTASASASTNTSNDVLEFLSQLMNLISPSEFNVVPGTGSSGKPNPMIGTLRNAVLNNRTGEPVQPTQSAVQQQPAQPQISNNDIEISVSPQQPTKNEQKLPSLEAHNELKQEYELLLKEFDVIDRKYEKLQESYQSYEQAFNSLKTTYENKFMECQKLEKENEAYKQKFYKLSELLSLNRF
jgi:hypothetical protein